MYYYRPKLDFTKEFLEVCIILKHIFLFTLYCFAIPAHAFKFSIMSEPVSLLNTQKLSYTQDYLLDQLHASLFTLTDEYILKPNLAKLCKTIKSQQVYCELKSKIKFSDGTNIQCKHFINTFKYLITNPNKNTQFLSNIKGYEAAIKAKDINKLRVQCINHKKLKFTLKSKDPNFLYNFTNYSTAPSSPNSQHLFSGPYQLNKWELGSFIELTQNPHSKYISKSIKNIKVYFIKNPNIALKMYEKNLLDFLTYLPTEKINMYKDKKDLLQIPVDRFDYIGIERLKKPVRTLLSQSINYKGLQKLYSALGTPGCPSLSPKYFKPYTPPCLSFKTNKSKLKKTINLTYSLAGGTDISKGMQYIKNQIEQNTELKINLNPVEPGQFISSLKSKNLQMYRRGVSLQTPRCYEALKIFHSKSYRNYSGLNDKKLDQLIENLKSNEKLCYTTVKYLIDQFYIIPQGRIHFSMLLKPIFTNLKINPLNQLDLSQIETN